MRKLYLAALLLSSAAYAHEKALRDAAVLSITGQDYDLAFKLEDACIDLGLEGKECVSFLGRPGIAECVLEQYVPLADFAKKNVNKSNARGHIGTETDTELGKHFYTIDSATTKAAVSAYEAKLIRDKAESLRSKDPKAVLSKADWATITKKAKKAEENPLLGGHETNLICTEKHLLCIGATGQKVLSPLWEGPAPKTTEGYETGRQLKPEAVGAEYREKLKGCAKVKDAK